MEQTGNLKILAERLREKAEQERIQTEAVFSEQLRILKDGLQTSSQNALHTMSDAMAQEIMGAAEKLSLHYKLLSRAFGKQWLCLAALGMAFCFGMLASGWGLVRAGAWHLARYRSELAQLERDCQALRWEMEAMKPERAEAETWGLSFQEDENGRFIILPLGAEIVTTWTVGERQAIKLE